MGPPYILIADTGALLPAGGSLHASVTDTNVEDGLLISNADADTSGADNEARSEVHIEGFDIILLTTNNVRHRLTLDVLQAEVSAACSSTGVVLRGGIQIDGLTLDGTPVTVTGEPGQTLAFDEFSIIFNEQASGLTLTNGFGTIAAIHIIVNDCMHGYVGFVHADIECTGMTPPPVVDCPDFVTGGGWIVTTSGAKANFGVGGGIRKGDFWGHLNYKDHGTGMHVKATEVTGYTELDEVTRQIDYNVTIDGVPGTARVIVADNGEPGRNDTFSIELSNGYSAAGSLGGEGPGGGNIQLHEGKCKPDKWDCEHKCDKCGHKCHKHDHKSKHCDHKCDRKDHKCPWDENKCEHKCDKCEHKCEHHDHKPGKCNHKCDRKDHKCPWDENKCEHKCDKCNHKCEHHDHKPGKCDHKCDRHDHKCPYDQNKCEHKCDKCDHKCEHHDHNPGKCNHKCNHKDHKCDADSAKGNKDDKDKDKSKGKGK
jgi:hypothetical protein